MAKKGDEPIFAKDERQVGKGDKARPVSIPKDSFAENWERIFGSTKPKKK